MGTVCVCLCLVWACLNFIASFFQLAKTCDLFEPKTQVGERRVFHSSIILCKHANCIYAIKCVMGYNLEERERGRGQGGGEKKGGNPHPFFMRWRFHNFISFFSPSLTSVNSSIIYSEEKRRVQKNIYLYILLLKFEPVTCEPITCEQVTCEGVP